MAASTEVRVPFLDRRLAEFMATQVPPSMKLKGKWRPTTKYLLRKAMKGTLPDEVLDQPKAGFGAPVNGWIGGELDPMIRDLLSESRVKDRGWFEPTEVADVLREHRQGRADKSLQIWALLTFELWEQQFIDG
jgi:asparagine synthase (glutamine-hydrolysing)